MKVLFSGYRDINHSSAGGYDKIIGFPNSDYICDKDVPFGFIPLGKRGKGLNLFFLDLYTHILRRKYDIVHCFYGDTIILPFAKKLTSKTVATIHLAINHNRSHHHNFINVMRKFDGIIVLSSQQEKELREKYEINAKFIPHGFLKPIFNTLFPMDYNHLFQLNKINIFYSGTNYRDIELFIKTVEFCRINTLDIYFHAVGQSSEVENKLKYFDNVICYRRLSDDEYFTLLSMCDYNFLPLTFATANNALLEAQYLGIKGIYPKIPGIDDYAASNSLNFFYKDVTELWTIFENLNKTNGVSDDLIKYAERFSWENIYEELDSYYKTLL